jgi:nicotinate-nucleotide adenylyltransferase
VSSADVIDAGVPRVGVFGALFNPPHIGHLVLCQEAWWQLGLQRVVLVPTGRPSHRPDPPVPADVRLRLAQAAALGNPGLTVSRVEVDRPGPSYMIDTLRDLNERYPGAQLVLLIGADQLAALASWHEAASLPRLARLAVARRSGAHIEGAERAAVDWIDMPRLDVSSSLVRERVAAGRPIRYLVPEPVRELIEAEDLYRTAS